MNSRIDYLCLSTRIHALRFFLSKVTPSYKSYLAISFLVTLVHNFFGLPLPLTASLFLHPSILQKGASCGLLFMCPNQRQRFSLILFSINANPNFTQNDLIPNSILPHVPTYPSKHMHLQYVRVLNMIPFNSPMFCTI